MKVTITEGSEANRLFLEPGPRTNCRLVFGSPELVHQGPQPEAHKSIHDYRDQLAAKKKRKKR